MSLILASNSPRRKELLTSMGYNYIVETKEINEDWKFSISAKSTAMSLAFQKGIDVALSNPDDIVLSADTLVVFKNRIIGKPKNFNEAYEILSALSNNYHKVITGFSIIVESENIKIVDFDESIVNFKKLSEKQIREYLYLEEPYDKAGAYGIQGGGKNLIENFSGSYNNIVGLPTEKLKVLMSKLNRSDF